MKIIKIIISRIYKIYISILFFSILTAFVYKFIDPPITPLMIIRVGESIIDGDPHWIDKSWRDYDELSNYLKQSVIASEDGRFMSHSGIDWRAVREAQKYNIRKKGKKKRGASTITMQCARNVFLWQGRNFLRKGMEVYYTALIEAMWSKERILEVYLNVIEWGRGVYGAEAACQKYYKRDASDLTRRQAGLLAAVLPNPRKWSPSKPTSYINRRQATISARAKGVAYPRVKKTKTKK